MASAWNSDFVLWSNLARLTSVALPMNYRRLQSETASPQGFRKTLLTGSPSISSCLPAVLSAAALWSFSALTAVSADTEVDDPTVITTNQILAGTQFATPCYLVESGLVGGLYDHDWFMVAADFDSYAAAQRSVDARWADSAGWSAAAVRNIAHMGWFSSDRTIREYARDIWGIL